MANSTTDAALETIKQALRQEQQRFFNDHLFLSEAERNLAWEKRQTQLLAEVRPQTRTQNSIGNATRQPLSSASLMTDLDRVRNESQHSAPAMSRMGSGWSSLSGGSRLGLSSTSADSAVPRLFSQSRNLRNGWNMGAEVNAPYFGSASSHSMQREPSFPQRPAPINEIYEPEEYFFKSRNESDPVFLTPSPTLPGQPQQLLEEQNMLGLPQSPTYPQHGQMTPLSPTQSYSPGFAPTDMARGGSMRSFIGAFEMARLNSNNDMSSFDVNADMTYKNSQSSMDYDLDVLKCIGGGASDNSKESYSHPHPALASHHTSMERSESTESTVSNRSARRLAETNLRGAKTILVAKEDPSTKVQAKANDNGPPALEEGAKAISKQPYTRPVHDKLYCEHCEEREEGFKGQHELSRHMQRRHALDRVTFVCVDGGAQAIKDGHKLPAIPLDHCKNCRDGKEYGIYYNAASHLRRCHFDPNPRKANKVSKISDRAGKAGGSEPTIEILRKYWFKEKRTSKTPKKTELKKREDDKKGEVEMEDRQDDEAGEQKIRHDDSNDFLANKEETSLSTPSSLHFNSAISADSLAASADAYLTNDDNTQIEYDFSFDLSDYSYESMFALSPREEDLRASHLSEGTSFFT